jgi:hypothetical protein
LRAWATVDGEKVLYQEGALTALQTPRDLMERCTGGPDLAAGTAMFCGTLGAIGGIRPGTRFEMELVDPVLHRTLRHAYEIESLPVVA